MPPHDRKYVKQNIKRAIGHVEVMQQYLQAIGNPYLEMGKQISDNTGDWPEEYISIIDSVDMCMDLVSAMNDLLNAMYESI